MCIVCVYFVLFIMVDLVMGILFFLKCFFSFNVGLEIVVWYINNYYVIELGDYFVLVNLGELLLYVWLLVIEIWFGLGFFLLVLLLIVRVFRFVFVMFLVDLNLVFGYCL